MHLALALSNALKDMPRHFPPRVGLCIGDIGIGSTFSNNLVAEMVNLARVSAYVVASSSDYRVGVSQGLVGNSLGPAGTEGQREAIDRIRALVVDLQFDGDEELSLEVDAANAHGTVVVRLSCTLTTVRA